jgi:hypothetical protein
MLFQMLACAAVDVNTLVSPSGAATAMYPASVLEFIWLSTRALNENWTSFDQLWHVVTSITCTHATREFTQFELLSRELSPRARFTIPLFLEPERDPMLLGKHRQEYHHA